MKNLKLTLAALVFAAPAFGAVQPKPGLMSRMYTQAANAVSGAASYVSESRAGKFVSGTTSDVASWSAKQVANGTANFKNASVAKKAAIILAAASVVTAASVYAYKKFKQYRAKKAATAKTTVA